MKQYKDLNVKQRYIFNELERTYIKDNVRLKDLLVALGVFLNKYKKHTKVKA